MIPRFVGKRKPFPVLKYMLYGNKSNKFFAKVMTLELARHLAMYFMESEIRIELNGKVVEIINTLQ